MRYTTERILCTFCKKLNYFYKLIVEKNDKFYLLTKCPKCEKYEEVRLATPTEVMLTKDSKLNLKDET